MTYEFEASDIPIQMTATLNALQRSAIETSNQWRREGLFEQAMANLLGIEISLAAGFAVPKQELTAFKRAVVDRIREQSQAFRIFVIHTDSAAEDSREGWYRASFGRSVLQILIDNYHDVGIKDLIDFDQVAEIDEILQENAEKAPPVFDTLIPPGLPATHWWWTAPTGPLLEIDEYGDVW